MHPDACPHVVAGGMPPAQGPIQLERHRLRRVPLLHYRDFLRGSEQHLRCDVIPIDPCLNMPWRYTEEQAVNAWTSEFPTVWLHSAAHPNGAVYDSPVYRDLRTAVNQLAQARDSELVRYSLLVSPEGMHYDDRRFGGDCPITTPSGRMFTFSVRQGIGPTRILLAIAWN